MVCAESLDILYIPRYQNGQGSSQSRKILDDHQKKEFFNRIGPKQTLINTVIYIILRTRSPGFKYTGKNIIRVLHTNILG
jgi:hypothetical protein